MDIVNQVKQRFKEQFEREHLKDVKFFADSRACGVSTIDIFAEIALIEDALAANRFSVVQSVDRNLPQKRFDADF
jgi:hypothetical protein